MIEYIECDTASKFLTALNPQLKLWREPGIRNWIFRGQSDSRWPLLPPILRPVGSRLLRMHVESGEKGWSSSCKSGYVQLPVGTDSDRFSEAFARTTAEWELVQKFAERADEAGISLPGDPWIQLREPPKPARSVIDFELESTFQRDFAPNTLTAAAQHHGIPTRLLDWTRKPLVAAHFAAEAAYFGMLFPNKKWEQPDHIAVWAFDSFFLRGRNSPIRLMRYGSTTSSYLKAQAGLFMWNAMAEIDFIKSGRWIGFEETLEPMGEFLNLHSLVKVTLPRGEITALRELLRSHGISRDTLMPSLDNVALEVFPRYLDCLPDEESPSDSSGQ